MPPGHAVQAVAGQKFELDLHLAFALVDEVLLHAGAGLAPKRPRDGIQKRGLAVAVVAAQAGHVDALKVQRGGVVTIRKKVSYRETYGYQFVTDSAAA